MACRAFGCKQEAKFENGLGLHVCSAKCAAKLTPDAHLIMADRHHMLDHPSDPSLIHIHMTSPMIGIYRKEPTLILRQGKTSLDQCVSAERPDYFEVNKKVANALKTALVGISKEEIERELAEAQREAQELARKRQELQRQLDQVNAEERKRKLEQAKAKRTAKEEEKERKAEQRRLQKEETRKRRNEKARKRRQAAKEKREAEEGARKKATGKQLDELNDDVLLLMIAQLDNDSLRALAAVNRRFNSLAFPSMFKSSSPEGKMRFIYLSILNDKWDNVNYAFSKYDEKLYGFTITAYFRKLLMWSSPWEKADEFAFRYAEGATVLSEWTESTKLTVDQVEKALDWFIRLAFYKENSLGERQPMSTPDDLRMFVPITMRNLATFHHLKLLNRFFSDPMWSQTIVIDQKIAKQEMMIQAAYAGFAEFVAQMVADPTIDLTYKNSSVFGVVTQGAYRSPYSDAEIFLTSEGSDGPTDIRDELNEVAQVLLQSGRQFEKINPDAYVQYANMFYEWNDWWDSESPKPVVIDDNILDEPVTSKKNTALASAIFNNRPEIIDAILPLHPPERLTNDANLARMLLYYYPVAFEDDQTPPRNLQMFEKVMKQSNYTLVPPELAPKMMYMAGYYSFEGTGSRSEKHIVHGSYEEFVDKLKFLLEKDPRITSQREADILQAYEIATGFINNPGIDLDDRFDSSGDEEDEDEDPALPPYWEEDPTKGKYPDPWAVYWKQVDEAAAMKM